MWNKLGIAVLILLGSIGAFWVLPLMLIVIATIVGSLGIILGILWLAEKFDV